MDQDQLRRRVAEARVARVGTVDEQGRAHLVPIVFVVDGVVVRLRGRGRAVEDAAERANARRLLWEKYPQFGDAPPAETAGPVMAVDIEQWSGWAYSD
jgi:nitroimidazol reductase NimA-like FMN-containing flavoprotein (pyridoxamine 5'-phosphate oxidase superfamily)